MQMIGFLGKDIIGPQIYLLGEFLKPCNGTEEACD